MRLRQILAGIVAVAMITTAQQAYAQQAWDDDANDQDWNNPTNWSGNAVPNIENAFLNIATVGDFPIISAGDSTFTPVDIFIGNGVAGNVGRLDHRADSLSLANVSAANGNWFMVGRDGATGTYNLADTSGTGGTLTGFATGSGSLTVGKLWVGGAAFAGDGTGTVRINTTGTITANSTQDFGGANESIATITLGRGAGSSGTILMDNGTVNGNGEVWTGYTGTGVWSQSGGIVNSSGFFVVGRNSSGDGTYNLSGGTVNAATGFGFAVLGSFAGANGELNVSGDGKFITTTGGLIVGQGGTGTLNVSGTGLVDLGTNHFVSLADLGGSTGTVNLSGGTLRATGVIEGSGNGTFTFTGGTLIGLDTFDVGEPLTQNNTDAPSRLVLGVEGDTSRPGDGSTMTIFGDYNLLGGSLVVDIFGDTVRGDSGADPLSFITDSDLVHVMGDADLNGLLAVVIGAGVEPPPFGWYDVLLADGMIDADDLSLTGATFSRVIDNPGGAGQILQVATPEPTAIAIWSLLGLALGGFGYFRHRRKK